MECGDPSQEGTENLGAGKRSAVGGREFLKATQNYKAS